jgi:hypothetical protein
MVTYKVGKIGKLAQGRPVGSKGRCVEKGEMEVLQRLLGGKRRKRHIQQLIAGTPNLQKVQLKKKPGEI